MVNWVRITDGNGQNTVWEFDEDAEASDSYKDANGTTTNGIRTFTRPDGKESQQCT